MDIIKTVGITPPKKNETLPVFGLKLTSDDISCKFGQLIDAEEIIKAIKSFSAEKRFYKPNENGDFVFVPYTFDHFLVCFFSFVKSQNQPVYSGMSYFDILNLHSFGVKQKVPLMTLCKDILCNATMLHGKLFFSTGKAAVSVMKLQGYRFKIKTDPNNREKCTITYFPPETGFYNLPNELKEYTYTLDIRNVMNSQFYKNSNVWKDYPHKMLVWHNIRIFFRIEVFGATDLDKYEIDESGDHLQDKLPHDFKTIELALANEIIEEA